MEIGQNLGVNLPTQHNEWHPVRDGLRRLEERTEEVLSRLFPPDNDVTVRFASRRRNGEEILLIPERQLESPTLTLSSLEPEDAFAFSYGGGGGNLVPRQNVVPEGPEPPVVKERWYDRLYPWKILGNPEVVAEDIANNPNAGNHERFIQHAIHTDLQEIHYSDSRQFILRSIGRAWNFATRSAIKLGLRAAIAVPEAIPFVGEGLGAILAWRAGRTHEIKFHVANAIFIDIPEVLWLVFVVTPAQLVPFFGQVLAVATAGAFIGIDAWKNGSARKHAREVTNQLIPKLHDAMSYEKNPNRADPRRYPIAHAIALEYVQKPSRFTRLSEIQRDLDPTEKDDYKLRKSEVSELLRFREAYRSFVNPSYQITADQLLLRQQIAREADLFTKRGRWKLGRKRMIQRDLNQLEYLCSVAYREKNVLYDHPYREATRMREMWDIAGDIYPSIKPQPKRRRR